MLPRRRTAALVAALTLAIPATALAQGAGDEQYTDPLAGGGGGGGGGANSGSGSSGGGSSGSGGASTGSGQVGAEGTSGSGAQHSGGPSDMGQSASASGAIPRTGTDPGLVALLGAGFILTGAGLRVRVRRPVG